MSRIGRAPITIPAGVEVKVELALFFEQLLIFLTERRFTFLYFFRFPFEGFDVAVERLLFGCCLLLLRRQLVKLLLQCLRQLGAVCHTLLYIGNFDMQRFGLFADSGERRLLCLFLFAQCLQFVAGFGVILLRLNQNRLLRNAS